MSIAEVVTCPIGEGIIGFIFSIIIIDISPIRFNPGKWILRHIGNALFADPMKRLERIEKDFENHKVSSWRHDILDFANSCQNGRKHSKEEFDYILAIHDEYEAYVNANEIENGQVELAHKWIQEIYYKCRKENNFL